MTTDIIVSPPDTKAVRTGTTWYIEKTEKTCLVLDKLTDDVFQIVFWDASGEFGDASTQASMIGSDVLACSASLIAEPTAEMVTMITSLIDQVMQSTLA
jgi:hypothetical protein